jgi:hypothetical protein
MIRLNTKCVDNKSFWVEDQLYQTVEGLVYRGKGPIDIGMFVTKICNEDIKIGQVSEFDGGVVQCRIVAILNKSGKFGCPPLVPRVMIQPLVDRIRKTL